MPRDREHEVAIERLQGAQIDDRTLDAFGRERFRDAHREMDVSAVGNDREIGSSAAQCRLPDGDRPPQGILNTIGTDPPQRYRIFAALLTSWLKPVATKSLNWISPIGRIPASAAPTHTPIVPPSAIGELRMRFPNSLRSGRKRRNAFP